MADDNIAEVFSELEQEWNRSLTALVYEAQNRLIDQSPVDTGRFRANWQIGEDSIDVGTTFETVVKPYMGTITIRHKYFLTNSLPYAGNLADGSSPQAAAGWVDLIEQEMAELAEAYFS